MTQQPPVFEGQTALITGASGGLGQAMALAFAARGAFVYVHYHRAEEAAAETLAALQEAGGEGALMTFDVREKAQVDDNITRIIDERGQLDILVNNAGMCHDTLFPMMTEDDWQVVLDVNVKGVFLGCRAAIRHMLRRRRGSIINVASVAGLHASIGQANYSASKGAVLSFTRTLAAEVASGGVRVNALVPGLIEAGMVLKADRRRVQKRLSWIPLKRMGTADEVAKAACFLASDDASYVIGHALVVDGGLTL